MWSNGKTVSAWNSKLQGNVEVIRRVCDLGRSRQ